jgi:hypothetical protein
MKASKMIGAVLIIAGLAVLIFGIVQYTQFSGSVAGKLSGVVSGLTGSRSDEEMKYIIMMIAGGIAALFGIVITVKK